MSREGRPFMEKGYINLYKTNHIQTHSIKLLQNEELHFYKVMATR